LVHTVIILASAAFGTVVAWRAPGLERYSRDWLVRLRGPVAVSEEIAIVAIDDLSVARFGRFPWPRSVIARALDSVAAAQPKAIALDVLFVDPTSAAEDQALADAIGRAGNVVLGSQLIGREVFGEQSQWLMPMPLLAGKAAATGHVNVGTESDGSARQILVEQSDDVGNMVRAMPIEVFRVGNHIPERDVIEGWNEFAIGPRSIPVRPYANPLSGNAKAHRAVSMAIDYAGPAGSFAGQQFSISEVLDGKMPAGALRGKYVLIGSDAASLGEHFSSPFVHYADAKGNQHGAPISGLEVLANALNTIVRGRFYSDMPDLPAFGFSAISAWLIISLLALAQGRRGALRFVLAIGFGLTAIVGVSYCLLAKILIFPPLLAALISAGSAAISSLAMRSMEASAALDQGIRQVINSLSRLETNLNLASTMESIVHLTGVTGALLLNRDRVIGSFGYPTPIPRHFPDSPVLPSVVLVKKVPLREGFRLILVHAASNPPSGRATKLAEALASASLDALPDSEKPRRGIFPDALEEKTVAMIRLNQNIARQAEFFQASMRAVEDGLLIAASDGSIVFANPQAVSIFDVPPSTVLDGRNLFDLLPLAEHANLVSRTQLIESLVLDRRTVERELTIRSQRFTLRLAPVVLSSQVAGLVASLSDITRQHELAQVRSDVVTLVSHEMRTPLTAIQGMTELMAAYDIEPVRRKEMMLAINYEVKRLAGMISDYLDLARLEMGKDTLRIAPLHLSAVVERSLLLFEPLAQEKGIRLVRHFDSDPGPILGDVDLLSRVFSNLISNAVKYSPSGTQIQVSTYRQNAEACVTIEDQGYGIPPADLERIFEKFYRVPRLQDADVPGTGLGLTFVREIVELHGGTVSATSSPGEGSVFAVCLPSGSPNPVR
jgi:signal transduction histidine kinase/CHASE2 domain-containing sensor protein